MRRLPRTLAVTCWVNWNGPGLTNFPNRRVLYERATSRAEVEAHRVHVLCEYTRTRWLGPPGTAGPSELPLTFSVYTWLRRTVSGVTVTSRLDADAGTANTSRPTVASNPARRRREDIGGVLPGAPPKPPDVGATLPRWRGPSQADGQPSGQAAPAGMRRSGERLGALRPGVHPEGPIDADRLGGPLARPLRLAPSQEHGGQVVLRVGEPGARPHSALDLQPGGEVPLGVVEAPHGGRQDSEPPRNRSEADLDRRLGVAVPIRKQQRVQRRRGALVPERCTRVGEQDDAEQPLGVDVLVGQVARQQVVERRTGVSLAAELRVEVRQRAAESHERRILVHGTADRLLELGESALCPAQHEQGQPLRDLGVPALAPRAEDDGLGDQPLRALEVALHEREHGPVRADAPPLGRLAQFLGETRKRRDLDVDGGAVRQRPQGVQSVIPGCEHHLLVADLLGQRDQLLSNRKQLLGVVRTLGPHPVALERVRERGGIPTARRDLHGFIAEADPALPGAVVARGRREPGQQPDSPGAVPLADRGEAALEERDERGVGAGARPGEPSAVALGRPRKPLGPAVAFGDVRSAAGGGLGLGSAD